MPKSILLVALMLISSLAVSQEKLNDNLKIFLDCNRCDHTYIKQNLSNVQFVRDQGLSDVHLFFLIQANGSGGRLYEIDFIGKNQFEKINYKLKFSTNTDMTSDNVRNEILKHIKIGLVRYWIENGNLAGVTVTVPSAENEPEVVEKDAWNFWVFRLGANGNFNGEETNKSSNLNFNVSAKRVTEKNKFSLRASFGENKSTFTFDGSDIVAVNNSKSLNVSDVLSINSHWSYGIFGSIGTSTYRNYKLFWRLRPAIEYNFFKYEQSAKKQLILSYRNGLVFNDYIERSVFGEDKELVFEHSLLLGGSIRQEWGNINGEVSFNQYLHDTTLNSLGFYVGANVRVFKGFNVNIGGNYRITRNQINLPGGDVSLEELLLQQQQLQSGYNYWVSIGFSYSFGSIYNSIVNPRFNF
ncbi:hypothetical protein IMCC3317_33560 [Kordia antarctica]|uniref:Outer membrane protein beta-barrel domain-containing protein n=1 Tax=Kordia antarctica TaxID=1218801 RepID=A0A7L4ZMP3_9FLAO|nr:hypothetical protein [Kordia antarctica]QHI37973.1 hypothetical protein IMCC3317_33560 [Kordia antarctica]